MKKSLLIAQNSIKLNEDCVYKPGFDPMDAAGWIKALKQGKILFSHEPVHNKEIYVGTSNIDWSGGHLDHQEWPAQLNRFRWLPYLSMEYTRTKDEALAEIAANMIREWIKDHKYSSERPPDPGDNTLSISVRLGQGMHPGWWCTIHDFIGSKAYDDDLINDMIESTKGQLQCLKAHLAPKGNWRISHLDCILHCSLIVPELSGYTRFAVEQLNETFDKQIHNDGSHEEHNPTSYHAWMCRLFTRLWYLSGKRPELGLRLDTQKIIRMWDYDVHTTAPDGGSSGLHDSAVWKPGSGHIKSIKERETIIINSGSNDTFMDTCKYFPDAGQIYMRSSWEKDAVYGIFDATRWGGAHCHLSRLSFNLYSGSRMLLYDPGYLSYEMKNPYGPHGKSTPAHNTASPPGLSQTEADPHMVKVEFNKNYAIAASSYEGGYFSGEYGWNWQNGKGEGIFGMHFRAALWIKNKYFLILDHIKADNDVEFNINWHLPPEKIIPDDKGRFHTTGTDDNLLIAVAQGEDFEIKLIEGQKEPLLGWFPDPEKNYITAPVLCVGRRTEKQSITAETILAPYKGADVPDIRIEQIYKNIFGRGLIIKYGEKYKDIVVYSYGLKLQAGEMGPVTTDGTMAVISMEYGRIKGAYVIDGTYIRYDDEYMIKENRPGTYEMIK